MHDVIQTYPQQCLAAGENNVCGFQIQNNASWTALLFLAAGIGSLLLAARVRR